MNAEHPVKNKRTCSNGHVYYKSSDCPVCPVCENEREIKEGLFSKLSGPARRALENAGIFTPEQLAQRSEKDILKLHGMGPASLPVLRNALKLKGLSFRK